MQLALKGTLIAPPTFTMRKYSNVLVQRRRWPLPKLRRDDELWPALKKALQLRLRFLRHDGRRGKCNQPQFAMPRKRRVRKLSSSPSAEPERDLIALSDDEGTADLTLHILAKALKRGLDDGPGVQVIALDSDEHERSEKEDMVEGGGARGLEPVEEGEVDGDAGSEAREKPVATSTGKKKKKKKEKKERRKKEVCVVMKRLVCTANFEDIETLTVQDA